MGDVAFGESLALSTTDGDGWWSPHRGRAVLEQSTEAKKW